MERQFVPIIPAPSQFMDHGSKEERDVSASTFEYIEVFFNRQRRHSTLAYLSPVIYEQRYNG